MPYLRIDKANSARQTLLYGDGVKQAFGLDAEDCAALEEGQPVWRGDDCLSLDEDSD